MNRLGPGVQAGLEDFVFQQVALCRRWRPDVYGLIGHLHMQGIAIGIGIDSHGLDTHLARGLDHAAGNLTAVCNQDFVKHVQIL